MKCLELHACGMDIPKGHPAEKSLPTEFSPVDYPSNLDRTTRALIGILVNSGIEPNEAVEFVTGDGERKQS